MSKYHVWVNCSGYQRLVVEAGTPEEAENVASGHFQCNESGPGDIDRAETRIATEDDLAVAEDWT